MNPKDPQIAVTEPEKQLEFTVFTSLIPAVAGIAAKGFTAKNNVSRQPSNSRRREGTFKGPRGIQASDRREVRHAILHHLARRQGCSSVSLRGVAADRRETGAAIELQPDQEKVSQSHQLLRPAGGDRRARPAADSSVAAGRSRDKGRSGGSRESNVPRSAEHRGLQEGHRREPVHAGR